MPITSEVLDNAIKAAEDYEKTSLGLKYGPDFPEFATALLASKKFMDIVVGTGMGGMLAMLTLPKENKSLDRGAKLLDDLKTNPLVRDNLALAFYVGFKLGQRATEIDKLEELAG